MTERIVQEERWAPKPGQMEAVRNRLMAVHDDEEITYTACAANGCFNLCLLKCHHKNGRITAVETDDTINLGSGREDAYTPWESYEKGMIQHRACPRGRAWKQELYHPHRLLYPMKRKHYSQEEPHGELRGCDEWERISWDEALDLVADGYRNTREKYGPLSVWMDVQTGANYDPFSGFLPGGGISGSGADSFYPSWLADSMNYGNKTTWETWLNGTAWGGTEGPTILEADLIMLWGFDTVLNYPEYQYWFQLAKEKGIPIIYIDPRFTCTAQTIATQYIPIRPGTDAAAMLAMAYVMFEEDIYDHEFCEKWVDEYGLYYFRQYVMGEAPGEEPKTPEWAAELCGIPAETLRELARLYASADTCYFRQVWAAQRTLYGIDTARILNYVNALGGNVGKRGACSTGTGFDVPRKPHVGDRVFPYVGTKNPDYQDLQVCEQDQWQRAVLLHEKLEAGEITELEYKNAIGCPKDNPAPNIKALIFLIESPRQFIGNYKDTNQCIAAIKKLDFVACSHWNMMASSCRYADVLLPTSDWAFEGGSSSGYWQNGPFMNGLAPSLGNYFIYYNKVIDAPGECAHPWWIEKEIGNRLGLADKLMPFVSDVSREDFDDAIDRCMGAAYEAWAKQFVIDQPHKAEYVPTDWEEFKKKPMIRVPMDRSYAKYEDEMENDTPFLTKTGKIEFWSEEFATQDPSAPISLYGESLGKPLAPMARWRHNHPESMFSPKTNKYPLYMVTPHSFFRQNMYHDANPMMRDEYRNSVWISPSDAKQRGIKDGDLVMAFNDVGEVMVPAYVTSRLTPGTACLIFGRYYQASGIKTEKMPDGIDRWGNCNFLIPNETYDDIIGPLLCNALIDVRKVDDMTTEPLKSIAQNGGN